MTDEADKLYGFLREATGFKPGAEGSENAWQTSLATSESHVRIGVLITDGQGQVLSQRVSKCSASNLPQGYAVTWTPDPTFVEEPGRPIRASLDLSDGRHIALVYPLGNAGAYLLVHQSMAAIDAECAQLVRILPAINAITLVWTCVPMSIVAYMIVKRFLENVDRDREATTTNILRQTQEVVRTRNAVIFGLAKLAEFRDPDTGRHLDRISAYSTLLASALQDHPKFRDRVSPEWVRLIGISSVLHDIGKVGVPDKVLLKQGRLTDEERACMQAHATVGGQCLQEIERHLGSSNFLRLAREIAFSHHERWDGKGYPHGLAGEAIPLGARIVAIADVYDALSSRRVYKQPLPHPECVTVIRDEAGKQFDPDLVDIWSGIASKYRDIARRYAAEVPHPSGPRGDERPAERQSYPPGHECCLVGSGLSDA